MKLSKVSFYRLYIPVIENRIYDIAEPERVICISGNPGKCCGWHSNADQSLQGIHV